MTRPILTLLLIALASSWTGPAPRGAVQLGVTPAAVRPLTAERHLGAPRSEAGPAETAGVPTATGEVGTVLIGGTLSYVDPKYGPEYLALPFPRGTVATICGPADCVTRRSTDYGPDQRVHPNRIADLSAADFVFVCGVPLSVGLCRGTVELDPPVHVDDDRMRVEDGGPTLPATDSAP